MVILTERDENVAAYLAVTPVGKSGYLTSRLVFPAAISVLLSIVILEVFKLTAWTLPDVLLVSLLSGVVSMAVALFLVAYSQNRVEGMALAKLSGVILLGLPVPFFLTTGVQYLFSPLPSFWIAKAFTGGGLWNMIPALLTSALWIGAFRHRFERKLF